MEDIFSNTSDEYDLPGWIPHSIELGEVKKNEYDLQGWISHRVELGEVKKNDSASHYNFSQGRGIF